MLEAPAQLGPTRGLPDGVASASDDAADGVPGTAPRDAWLLPARPAPVFTGPPGTRRGRWREWLAGRSLQFGLTAALLLNGGAGVLLVTLLLVGQAERDTLQLQRLREMEHAVALAAQLSRRVVELQQALSTLQGAIVPDDLADSARMSRALAAQPSLRLLFSRLVVAAPEGRVLAVVDRDGVRTGSGSAAGEPWLAQVLRERRALVTDVVHPADDGQPRIVMAEPLTAGDSVFAVVAGELQLARRGLLADLAEPVDGTGGAAAAAGAAVPGEAQTLVVVTDGAGRLLAHPRPAMLLADIGDEPRLAGAAHQWQVMGRPAEPQGLMLPQAGETVGAAGVAGQDWVVWRASREAAWLEPLRAARREALAWAALALALGVALGSAVIGWMLRPLRRLEARAERLFDATLDVASGWPGSRGEIGRLEAVLRHVSAERARLEAVNGAVLRQLERAAAEDPLTGLANRLAFGRRLQAVMGERRSRVGHALVLLDLDHFKPINDHAGHAAGDAMLRAVAGAIRAAIRQDDLAVRLGGDEFAVVLQGCDLRDARRLAQALLDAIHALRLPWQGTQLHVGASAGVAMLQPRMQAGDDWVRAADEACYAAKAAGRGGLVVAVPA